MYYVANGKVYADAGDGKVKGVSITAKDKVVTHRELESVTPKLVGSAVELPEGAVPCTLDMVIAKFNVSESNPVVFKSDKGKKEQ